MQEFLTTQNGFRLATSVGAVLKGRGADFIIIDDPLKPEEAFSESQWGARQIPYAGIDVLRGADTTADALIIPSYPHQSNNDKAKKS